jgi:hypothetical protein
MENGFVGTIRDLAPLMEARRPLATIAGGAAGRAGRGAGVRSTPGYATTAMTSPSSDFLPIDWQWRDCHVTDKLELCRARKMVSKAREYIDFWIENSVHAAEAYRVPGASQDVTELVRRLVEGARDQGITEQSMQDEVGDLTEYLRDRLKAANAAEDDRRKR